VFFSVSNLHALHSFSDFFIFNIDCFLISIVSFVSKD